MRTRTSIILGIVGALALLGAACSDDDAQAPDTTAPAGPVEAAGSGIVELVALDSGSPYVRGLCSIDFFEPGDEEDPMGWLVGELQELPTTTPAEADEVDWMVDRIRRADKIDDPLATDDLTSVAAVLRARCS
jgi:hypothetical protein